MSARKSDAGAQAAHEVREAPPTSSVHIWGWSERISKKWRRGEDEPDTCDETSREIQALKSAYPDEPRQIEVLYDRLSIIDSKAASLLTFNAIGLTAIAVWLQYVPLNPLHLTLDVAFILFVGSCAFSLLTARIYWAPKDRRTEKLFAKSKSRTFRCGVAWWLSMLAVIVLVGVSSLHGFGTLLKVTDRCPELCQLIFSEDNWGLEGSGEGPNGATPPPTTPPPAGPGPAN